MLRIASGKQMSDKKDKGYARLLALASTIGINLVVSTFIGLLAGYYLDKWLDTKPWFLLICLILGIIAGFKNVFDFIKESGKEDR